MFRKLAVLFLCSLGAYAQFSSTAHHVYAGPALPAHCSATAGDVFVINNTTPTQLYLCTATDTWTVSGGSGSGGVNLQSSAPGTQQTGNININGVVEADGGFRSGSSTPLSLLGLEQTAAAAATACNYLSTQFPCLFLNSDYHLAQSLGAAGTVLGTEVAPESGATTNQWVDYVTTAGVAHKSYPTVSVYGTTCTSGTSCTPTVPVAYGGTGSAYFTVSGPTATRPYTFPDASATITRTIASGTAALGTAALASGKCYGDSSQPAVVTATATGTLTTDVLTASFNGDPHAITGYIPSTAGMLTIISYPTADTANFMVCNNTASSITPGAITLNWRVVR